MICKHAKLYSIQKMEIWTFEVFCGGVKTWVFSVSLAAVLRAPWSFFVSDVLHFVYIIKLCAAKSRFSF